MYTTTLALDAVTQENLSAMALQRNCSEAEIIQELVNKSLNYDAWLRAEIQKGLDAADRGDSISQEEMDDVVRGMGIRVS